MTSMGNDANAELLHNPKGGNDEKSDKQGVLKDTNKSHDPVLMQQAHQVQLETTRPPADQ